MEADLFWERHEKARFFGKDNNAEGNRKSGKPKMRWIDSLKGCCLPKQGC